MEVYCRAFVSLDSCVIHKKMFISKCKHIVINIPHRVALLLLQRVFIIESSFVQEEDGFVTLVCLTAVSLDLFGSQKINLYPWNIHESTRNVP